MHRRIAPFMLAACMLAAFAFAGCAGTPPTRPSGGDSIPGEASVTTDAVRRMYVEGFAALAASVPPQEPGSPYNRLRRIVEFMEDRVRWAEIRGDSYFALEAGSRDGAWLVVVPPGHESLAIMRGAYMIEASPSITALLIKPAPVTAPWAGIFLVHEASHLLDLVSGKEPLDPTRAQFLMGELQAYRAELAAADILSRGALPARIDELLSAWAARGIDELTAHVESLSPGDRASLDATMPAGEPASPSERALRDGFYYLAIHLRFTAARPDGEREMLDALARLYPEH